LGESELAIKRAAYAAAGVPAYWLIDPDTTMATCLRLEGDAYTTYAEGPVVEVDWPVAVTVDVAEVARPQASAPGGV
jgi:Uma2 family endonuclease